MIYRNDMDVAKKTGGRGGTFCRKLSFRTPFPLFKDFDFIESLFILFWGMILGRPVNEESAVLKIFGAF